MVSIDRRVVDFILAHHVLTLATCAGGRPYCASLFYVYLVEENVLVFASKEGSRHVSEALAAGSVAGSMAVETRMVGLVRGLQWEGCFFPLEGIMRRRAWRAYVRRFPFAALGGARLWGIRLTFFKYTDNRLGFGKKIIVTLQSNEK
ncbi:MAG: pyridoxamine 5'-phosphate oxidase family protein [Prevotellaceae bacterium]|nr:pyridoxamine 5'-phosphate oxidase family protein [Prevotellaceae bacterium]